MKQKGFTLIELLVVISIIGLLASVVLVALNGARVKARDAVRAADVQQIQKALDLYYNDNNQYPPSGGATTPSGWSNDSDSSWTTLGNYLSPYMTALPTDPLDDHNPNEWANTGYHFSYYSAGYGCPGQWYMLVYQLETANGPDPGVTACNGTSFQYGGGGTNTTKKTVGVAY